MITGLAVAAVAIARPGPAGVEILLGALAVLVGGRAVFRLLRPDLILRLDDEGLGYRRGRQWSGHVRQPFVSPWFIGWRGRGLAGFGVFPYQLSKDQYRRLARCLRHSGSPLPE